jgi:hypothetical protein
MVIWVERKSCRLKDPPNCLLARLQGAEICELPGNLSSLPPLCGSLLFAKHALRASMIEPGVKKIE